MNMIMQHTQDCCEAKTSNIKGYIDGWCWKLSTALNAGKNTWTREPRLKLWVWSSRDTSYSIDTTGESNGNIKYQF